MSDALDFATGQHMADLVDRELGNMRRTPAKPAPVPPKQIPDALLLEQMQDAAMPSVIAHARATKIAMAKDPLAHTRPQSIYERENPNGPKGWKE
jgi:hypothetical protein